MIHTWHKYIGCLPPASVLLRVEDQMPSASIQPEGAGTQCKPQ